MQLSPEDPEENWTVIPNAVHSSAADTLGYTARKHQDWFDENDDKIQGLLEEKHRLHKAHQDDTNSVSKKASYTNICKTVQSRLRDIQDSWLSKKAEEIESFADIKAITLLSSGKAPGSDAIPAEISKPGGQPMAEKLTELFHCMWRKEAIPQEFKDASIIHLYKRKGNAKVCENHRGISLLSSAGKTLAKILLNRLNIHLEQARILPESQCGFRKDRGTIDMIFTARQLQREMP